MNSEELHPHLLVDGLYIHSGLYKEPKWGHLRDLHLALKLCKKALLWGKPSTEKLGKQLEARVFEIPEQKVCVAFLSNHNTKDDVTLTFRGQPYFVPRHSISILADCKTVVFGTQHVNAQHNQRTFHFADQTNQNNVWQMFDEEKVPKYKQAKIRTRKAADLYNLTKDKTDYVWYTSRCAVACFKASSWCHVCVGVLSVDDACLPVCATASSWSRTTCRSAVTSRRWSRSTAMGTPAWRLLTTNSQVIQVGLQTAAIVEELERS